jgi:hypothetical protein
VTENIFYVVRVLVFCLPHSGSDGAGAHFRARARAAQATHGGGGRSAAALQETASNTNDVAEVERGGDVSNQAASSGGAVDVADVKLNVGDDLFPVTFKQRSSSAQHHGGEVAEAVAVVVVVALLAVALIVAVQTAALLHVTAEVVVDPAHGVQVTHIGEDVEGDAGQFQSGVPDGDPGDVHGAVTNGVQDGLGLEESISDGELKALALSPFN